MAFAVLSFFCCLVPMFCMMAAFIIAAPTWTYIEYSYQNQFQASECTVVNQFYSTENFSTKHCPETKNYVSDIRVDYQYDDQRFRNKSICNTGRVCRIAKGEKCKKQECFPKKRTNQECRKHIHPKLEDFYSKFSIGKTYDCSVYKKNPDYVTFEDSSHNLKWTILVWIPALYSAGLVLFFLFGWVVQTIKARKAVKKSD
ncbi:calcium-activated potassium channel subunit beta [Anaeramoeba flamelloides]|uniref:Calcium-activated potassium channel subunit beta n=1 Tax=Anaeramoeba flamelloides TaxID=1746091 RepID=A0AAV7YKT8_9EUKA|nr:calcium-activated potassium channel subunit beta [Anaeramoeba flamelloides]